MKKTILISILCSITCIITMSCNNDDDDNINRDRAPHYAALIKFADEDMKNYIPAWLTNCAKVDFETGYTICNSGDYVISSFNNLPSTIYEMVKDGDIYYEMHKGYYLYKAKIIWNFPNVYATTFKLEDVDNLENIYPKDDPISKFHYVTIDKKYIQKEKLFNEVVLVDLYSLRFAKDGYANDLVTTHLIEDADRTLYPQDDNIFTVLANNELVWCYNISDTKEPIQRNIKDVLQDELDALNELIDAGFPEEYCKKYDLTEYK